MKPRIGDATTLESLSSTCSGVAWSEGDLYWTYGSRDTLSVKDGETDIVRLIPVSTSSTKDIFVGRRTVEGPSDGECDFEKIKCRWHFKNSMSNDLDWTRRSAELTASNSTGPTVDHTTQSRTGQYMLLNTSSPSNSPGNLASLISPPVNVSGPTPKCFRFWYYMHDVTNGSLTVFFQQGETRSSPNGQSTGETKLTTLWSAYGSQPDEWVGAEIEVRAAGIGHVLIKAVVGDPRLNIIGIDDVHFGECQQDSRLVCEDSSMTVYLDKARLGISSQDRVSFKNSLCRGAEYDVDTVAITAPYNGCGTTVSESDDVILFSNQVNVMIHSDIRSSDVSIRVNCSMSRTYHVAMTYLAHAWIRYIREDGYGNFTVRIRQYTNVKFEDAYPGDIFPQQVEIDDRIYMATEMVTIKDVVDTIQNARCWATPSRDPSDPVSRDIINDGCPIGDGTKVYTLLTPGMQAFSFKAFSFSRDENLIYIHCDLIICHDSDQSACTSNCSHSRTVREARDTRETGLGPYTVSQGPFINKMAAAPQKDGASVNVILLSALVCTTVLLLAGVFNYARNRITSRDN
ncbi:ZP domain-containing protein-like [Strongylocentrotus purpuratus]|uniref:ZP domain-containing protein n=1 Tax=Strongylocentrotus purpuratus TaxID=7668 RepID=A0A7M7NW37_STRPU|nr:ZP domain-containing protein-like [Strongylocentrotus purpuratus]